MLVIQQQNIIGVPNNINNKEEEEEDIDNDNDNNDDDSIIPPLLYHDLVRASAFHWRTLTLNFITSWEQQAIWLNTHPIPGLLHTFPHIDLAGDLETMVMTALHIGWGYFVLAFVLLLSKYLDQTLTKWLCLE